MTSTLLNCRDDAATGPVTVWALWDAQDLLSLHATEQSARDARTAHLHRDRPWSAENQQLLESATQVVAMPLQTP